MTYEEIAEKLRSQIEGKLSEKRITIEVLMKKEGDTALQEFMVTSGEIRAFGYSLHLLSILEAENGVFKN